MNKNVRNDKFMHSITSNDIFKNAPANANYVQSHNMLFTNFLS
jgi:hypothetical protein